MTNTVSGHHIDCLWHLDQYPHECTCDAVVTTATGGNGAAPATSPHAISKSPGGPSKPRHDDALTERVADHIQQVVMLTRAEAIDAARAARFVIENAK